NRCTVTLFETSVRVRVAPPLDYRCEPLTQAHRLPIRVPHHAPPLLSPAVTDDLGEVVLGPVEVKEWQRQEKVVLEATQKGRYRGHEVVEGMHRHDLLARQEARPRAASV